MAELTLYVDSSWTSPSVFHTMVALEEKCLAYTLEVVQGGMSSDVQAMLRVKGLIADLPMLAHDDLAFTDHVAISEYLAERFPIPDHPRIFPADLAQRARSRQIMAWLRTRPLADELIRVAAVVVKPGAQLMFDNWCIADADLAFALMRMIRGQAPLPPHLVDYALAQWDRRSIKRFVAHAPMALDTVR